MAARTKKPAVEPAPTVEPARPSCQCGCGGFPKSAKGRYLPGHDARHASARKRAMANERIETAIEVIQEDLRS